MEFTYTIDSTDPIKELVTISYTNDDPELPPVTKVLHIPNTTAPEVFEATIKECAPVFEWGAVVQQKNLKVVVGDARTANRELLRPVSEIHIYPVAL
jgi:hypothetical protein